MDSTQSISPAIVVVAFNRPRSLDRILNSIGRAAYEGYENITLVISIDKGDCVEVSEIARDFVWEHGKKKVIEHEARLGLRNHVLACGDLSSEYKAVIILEDDLYVSPIFYDYAVKAMRFFEEDDAISGISLYAYDMNEHASMRFHPLEDGFDNYFVQSAGSWGQLWTERQWKGFRDWYDQNAQFGVNSTDKLPENVILWGEGSWKKYFIKYLVLSGKYFTFPRASLTSNMGDKGTHTSKEFVNNCVPMALDHGPYNFCSLVDSVCIYDSHFEIESHCLTSFDDALASFDFECDLYGIKNLKYVSSEYLLSIRRCTNPIFSYSIKHLPHELNIILGDRGDFFHLAKTEDFREVLLQKQLVQWRYLHKDLGWRRYWFLFLEGVLDRLGLHI